MPRKKKAAADAEEQKTTGTQAEGRTGTDGEPSAQTGHTGKQRKGSGPNARAERTFSNNDELDAAIRGYFDAVDNGTDSNDSCGRYDEFGLALQLGVCRATLVNWSKDEKDPERRFLVNQAFDKIAHQLISGSAWNDKFTTQKSMKMMEADRFGGFRSKADLKNDTKIQITFGSGADEACMN